MIEASTIQEKLRRSFRLWEDLVSSLSAESLAKDLAGLPSNTIGQQFWCVIGARQSYLKALMSNGWQGFDCSLSWENTTDPSAVRDALKSSNESFIKSLEGLSFLSLAQQSLLFDLIEHEAQHHGQLIRFLYAQKLPIPESWKSRYNLD